jgi:hypothetical protein
LIELAGSDNESEPDEIAREEKNIDKSPIVARQIGEC